MTVSVTKPAINVREELADLRKPSGIAGEAMLRAETPQEQFNLIGAGRRNLIINGAMQVAQRGTSVTGVSDDDFGACDRWKIIENGDTVVTLSQETDAPSGFNKSLKVTPTTSDSGSSSTEFCILTQTIEDHNVIQFGSGTSEAQWHTLSFWVKSNVTGKFNVELEYTDANLTFPVGYTIDTADTWEKKTVHIPPQTTTAVTANGGIGIKVFFWLMAGSGYSGSPQKATWSTSATGRATDQVNVAASTSNNFYITGVQLELGKVATPFEHRSYGEELALCQRYYQVLKTGRLMSIGNGSGYSIGSTVLPVSLRASASISYVYANGSNFAGYSGMSGTQVAYTCTSYASAAENFQFRYNLTNTNDIYVYWHDLGSDTGGLIVNLDAEL